MVPQGAITFGGKFEQFLFKAYLLLMLGEFF